MKKKINIISKETLFDGYFQLQKVKVSFETFQGKILDPVDRINFIVGNVSAAIVYNTDTKKILLVEQFRLPTMHFGDDWLVEIVAGISDTDEKPEETIEREMMEEIGYRPVKLKNISAFHTAPGSVTELVTVFYAEVNESSKVSCGGGFDEGEDIRVLEYSWDKVWGLLQRGLIRDAKTLIAVYWMKNKYY